ncbi:ABC transporter ATP-binding protein [Salipaludibacillus aurantiacus]|uniref:Quaternary amine transport ATP-binding protein n=1 Tax=Salipaludibacillus aurantiacus TaxID=1601833 RepID=A0A1H9SDE5_9BACI|nr:ABC transporter ATP-binding protein [Salipaludibacillus aurantiacus]SER83007.1 osmoprotectant transport system ATP-binding protein [Salipaludibacillus aurantiacus]
MIEFKNVTKTYDGKVNAVDDVSFTVPQGNIAVFLGPSGCGKTTLLRMVNRLVPITKGEIFIDGEQTNSLNEIQLRRNIGYVIQSNGLFPNMTIEDNVTVVPKLLGWDKEKMRNRFFELMELIGLKPDDFRKRYPHELSGGQQQRIGIARAMAADPPVMLMDEPFGALDPIIRSHLQKEFLQIQKEVQKTILFVSHDIDEAITMGDQVAIFKDGRLMQYDAPDDILANPANEFVSTFVGSDRAIKSLGLHTVADLVNQLKVTPVAADSRQISLKTDLRQILSIFFNEGYEELVVVDEEKKPMGSITIQDVQKYLHQTNQSA